MRRILGPSLAALLVASPLALAHAEPFDADQKKEIGEVVRAYLLEHPEVIVEAIQVLQNRQAEEEATAAGAKVTELRDQLLRDTRDPVIGNPKGDVTVVEFFDYLCGYCKQAQPVLMELVKADPNLRIVMKEFPILREESRLASRAALASVAQGKYAAFHEALINSRGLLSEDKIMTIATSVGLDTERLKKDMAAPAIEAHINDVHALAAQLSINGTPSFVIGNTLVPGAVNLDTLKDLVAKARATCEGPC